VNARPTLFNRLAGFLRFVFWGLLVLIVLSQLLVGGGLESRRAEAFAKFQEERKSRVIALIHRQDSVSFLGIPVASYISIDDSEAILRGIRLTPADQPIDFILHTPGGLVLASEQIANALVAHQGKVTVFVPHYAMSGGTLIALAADEIVMDANAVLGPIDPQIGGYPAASIIKVAREKPIERVADQTLILADVSAKAVAQVEAFVTELLTGKEHFTPERARSTAKALTEGRWTHDYPIGVKVAREFGLKVSTEMPTAVYELMALYPQAPGKRPTVLYLEPPRGIPESGGADAPTPPTKPAPPARGPAK
jgi:ClpP class serine protease